jgi:ribosomal-protein-alanine N-acetyltransferase
MPACPTLTTERLVLRPFRADDLDPLHAIMTTDEVRASLHVPDDFSRAAAWGSLISFAGLWEVRGVGQWALEERDSGRFVGRAGLYWRVEPEWPGVEVGWLLDPAVWGEGYATEAGDRAVRYGFDEVGEDTLYSVILPENTRSQAVARRLGFSPWEERLLPHFPSAAHMVWRLTREAPE